MKQISSILLRILLHPWELAKISLVILKFYLALVSSCKFFIV